MVVALLFLLPSLMQANEAEIHTFRIHQKDYRFSTVFEMDGVGTSHGAVVKSSIRVRSNYDVYDERGQWQATGIARVLCLGFFRPWGAEIDVYNPKGEIIGLIDGQVGTLAAAKYSIYNALGECVGIAFLDLTKAGFTILDPENKTRVIARLTRNFVQEQIDSWDVVVYDVHAIDPALVKVFAAFAVDKQNYFKKDS